MLSTKTSRRLRREVQRHVRQLQHPATQSIILAFVPRYAYHGQSAGERRSNEYNIALKERMK